MVPGPCLSSWDNCVGSLNGTHHGVDGVEWWRVDGVGGHVMYLEAEQAESRIARGAGVPSAAAGPRPRPRGDGPEARARGRAGSTATSPQPARWTAGRRAPA